MINAGRYPFDPSQYSRGDLVNPEDIERAFGVNRDHKDYWRSQLRFKEVLSDHFDGVVPIKSVGAGLYILPPDQESVDYFHEDVRRMRSRLARRVREATSVDANLVSSSELTKLSNAMARVSWVTQRMSDKKWTPPPPEQKRIT